MRGLRFRRAAEKPSHAMVAHLRGPYGSQRVTWHPAVEEMPDEAEMTVRDRASESGPVGTLVVELPGGVRLTPVGGVRREPPKRFRLTSRPGVKVDLGSDGRIVIVRDDPPPRPRRWSRRTPRLVLVGALLGGALGFGLDGAATVAHSHWPWRCCSPAWL
ncbi:hypothetical protein [Parafrankia sp. FMc2]|uniref:hypothetical protein n=1 Tax=Parafrankia sp. FMc2 TaxID=3233196 RepID=UPI0034D5CB2D